MAAVGIASAVAGAIATVLVQQLSKRQRKQSSSASDAFDCSASTSAAHAAPRYVPTPHPSWVPGQPQPLPFSGEDAEEIQIDPATIDKPSLYSFVISAVVPRPVGFISTVDSDGVGNLAPYSYFNAMGHNPPIVAFGACRHSGRPAVDGEPAKKDTLLNVEATGEFVVNIMSDWYVEAANHTCGDFPHGQDEMKLAGLTPIKSLKVKPPRVKEAAVQMECKVRQIIHFNDKSGAPSLSVVLGEVLMFHTYKGATERSPTGKVVVDPVKLRPISRLGGVVYGCVRELFELARPNGDGSYPPLRTKAQQQAEQQMAGQPPALKGK